MRIDLPQRRVHYKHQLRESFLSSAAHGGAAVAGQGGEELLRDEAEAGPGLRGKAEPPGGEPDPGGGAG